MRLRKPIKSMLEYYGEDHEEYIFVCPGCEHEHALTVKWGNKSGRKQPCWGFNGDMNQPTFTPSLLITWTDWTDEEYKRIAAGEQGIPGHKKVCHSFIKSGKIEFLNDCTHKLKGQTVEIAHYPEVKTDG